MRDRMLPPSYKPFARVSVE